MPAFPSRAEVEQRVDRRRLLELGQRTVRVRGGGTDFDQLRLVPSTATNFTLAGNPYNLAATAGQVPRPEEERVAMRS